jgi:hypothetical protein
MKNKQKGHKSWKSSTLFQRALKAKNEDKYWDYVHELRSRRRTIEIFNSAKELCLGSKIRCRQLGADVLGQLSIGFYGSGPDYPDYPNYPYRSESTKIVHEMLKKEKSPKVLSSILNAISHLQESEDTFGVWRISSFRNHKSEEVRHGVAFALRGRSDRISVFTMIHLSRDKSPWVRNWATFGLAQQIDLDTPGIRKALIDRANDSDYDAKCEALLGLAIRKDPRVRPFLIQELNQEDISEMVFEAAAKFGDKTLLPYIDQQIALADEETDDFWLYIAKKSRDELKNS